MDEIQPAAGEALFMLIASLVGELVDKGAISAQRLANMQSAFEMQAANTLLPQKKATCGLATQYAEVLSAMARMDKDEIRHPNAPHLRVVPSDDDDHGADR